MRQAARVPTVTLAAPTTLASWTFNTTAATSYTVDGGQTVILPDSSAPLWLLLLAPGWLAWGVISIWFLYRIVMGMVRMNKDLPMET